MVEFLTLVCICMGFTATVVYLREILLELRNGEGEGVEDDG